MSPRSSVRLCLALWSLLLSGPRCHRATRLARPAPEREPMLTREARGFRSALPEFVPEACTWRWPLGALELTGQLDHLTYDAALEPLAASVIAAGGSDHFPVRALLTRAPPGGARPRPPQGASLTLGFGPPAR